MRGISWGKEGTVSMWLHVALNLSYNQLTDVSKVNTELLFIFSFFCCHYFVNGNYLQRIGLSKMFLCYHWYILVLIQPKGQKCKHTKHKT